MSVLPSLPSTPSRVPSGHGKKSSILCLHSSIVRPKDIVRLSGDPLIQDSLTHPLSFFLSFHILIALVHPLHGNSYSLTLISIDGHLHSPLIRLVDVRLSPSFCLLHNHNIFYSTYSVMSMAHAHILRED